jgi:GAF domain-containing protein
MATLPEDRSVTIDELESAITELESRLESARAEHDEAKARQVELDVENANLRRELGSARERQTATSDILKMIASSPSDVQPVFEAIVNSAARLFDCTATMTTLRDGKLHWNATAASIAGFEVERARAVYPIPFDPDRSPSARAILERRIIEIPDVTAPDTPEFTRKAATAGDFQSITFVPLVDREQGIGTIIFTHPQTGFRFAERQLAIIQTFADQAVIAIQNARLFDETREALEQQTATSDILKVIASSPSEVQPVLDVIVNSAAELFAPHTVAITTLQDGKLHWRAIAASGPSFDHEKAKSIYPIQFDPDRSPSCRAIVERRIIEIPDVEAPGTPELTRWVAAAGGFRSATFVPLIHRGEGIGTINLTTPQAGFRLSEKQLTLVKTFADQAVIAIENTRLFNETRQALERQTATAEILKVIASSPSDVQPVFEAIASSAKTLLGAFSTTVLRFIGDELHLVAYTPTDPEADEALQSLFPRPLAEFPTFALVRNGETIQFPDTEADDVPPANKELGRLRGFRSVLFTPLMNQGTPVGIISVTRAEPGAFAPHHVQLLQTFADQAVIAIENVRLFDEVQARTNDLSESLLQQTAVGDVLKTISRSTFDLQPVLDTLVNSAAQLCDADMAFIMRRVGDEYRAGAAVGYTEAYIDFLTNHPLPVDRGTVTGRAVLERRPVQILDVVADPEYTLHETTSLAGQRTTLGVPLLRENEPIGVIVLARQRVEAFTEKQIDLVATFADQAVIAIENIRLFNETHVALERQTATADILKVIASSPSDVQPVFDAIAESANRLIDGFSAAVFRYIDDKIHLAAFTPTDTAGDTVLQASFPAPLDEFPPYHLTREGAPAELPDTDIEPAARKIARARGYRSMLFAPLMNDSAAIGIITVTRVAPGPFGEQHTRLLQMFADQAVIAIKNVGLFNEVQQRTDDLSEALQQQTATAEVLKVIASSPTEVGPALRAIVESACKFCDAYDANVLLKIGNDLHFSAHYGLIPTGQQSRPINRDWVTGRSVVDRVPVQVSDFQAPEAAEFPEGQRQSREQGHRCSLSVPLLREGEAIGALVLRRLEPVAFSDKQIALLQTFADQAVIAIGNVRLFEEVQAKSRDLSEALTYQTGSANILKVIASSPTDVGPVLSAIVESACELCEANDAIVFLREGDHLSYRAHHGPIAVVFGEKRLINRNYVAGRSVVDKAPVHVRDVFSDEGAEFPEARELSRSEGIRSILCVPLLRDNESIGAILLRRNEVQPFNDKQINLLRTFADQAVIAIGNVHLFEEVQARTHELTESLQQQTATADVLKVISASPGELSLVFQTMLENAVRLCEAKFAMLFLLEDGQFRAVGMWNLPPVYSEYLAQHPIRVDPRVPLGRVVSTKRPVQVADVLEEPAYIERYPGMVGVAELGGARTLLQVPMLKDDHIVGSIGIYRQEVRPFTDKQIALVQNFAAQAVIAIENARLLNELRQRTNDLSKSLDDLRMAQDRLVQTQKLASLGQLTAGIAHEIKNPLNFVNNFAALSAELTEELNDVLKPTELAETVRTEVDELTGLLKDNLEKVVQHGKRADSIVKNMLLHSREGGGEHRPSDINALIDESLNLAYHGARAEKPGFNVTLERDFDPAAGQIDVFPQEITRVFLNLVSNGFYAVTKRRQESGDPGFEPTLRASTRNLGDAVEIRIRDNGTGIPREVKEKMFNPFFTTKPAGEGTGLGLSMSHDIIVKQHGGTIDADTEQGHFTEFRIMLPRTSNFAEKSRGRP